MSLPTAERLQAYEVFDEAIIDQVADAAADQNQLTFSELADQYGLSEGPQSAAVPGRRSPLEYLHLKPSGDYDERKARLLVTPMATPVDESIAMRAMRLFATDPGTQLYVVGEPAKLGSRNNLPSLRELPQIWRGDMRSLARPVLRYLIGQTNVLSIDTIGYSCGADVAASAAGAAAEFGVAVERAVLMDSASTVDRGLWKLLQAFRSSEPPLDDYIRAAGSMPLLEARKLVDVGPARYFGGFLRLSNVAIAHALSSDLFPVRVASALESQKDLRATIVWGGASELADDAALDTAVTNLRNHFGAQRIGKLVVPGMHHAGADDIDLHAAMVLQGLQQAS